jgi:metallo-beta-lactamase family protein
VTAGHSGSPDGTVGKVGLTFHGAAGTVTGSCHLLEAAGRRILVDCGLFQGSKTLKELNYGPFPFEPASIDAVLLTHAHIDHTGLLPKLFRQGYSRRVIATAGTRDLLTYMLPDSGYIQETEVEQLNRRRRQRGEPEIQPIYSRADAERCLDRIDPAPLDTWVPVAPDIRARFWNAGHILGASSIEVEIPGKNGRPLRLLFSGDLGSADASLHEPPVAPRDIDYLIVEATYGDRDREQLSPGDRRARLAAEVRQALAAGGNLLIPVFAIERTQSLLYDLGILFDEGELPETHVFLDSPLAIQATRVFAEHLAEETGRPARPLFERKNFHFLSDVEASKRLNKVGSGAIILAASGMCEAGRIRHHLKNNLWRPGCTVLLVGYQAPGTLGRLLAEGATSVRIMGDEIAVKARIRALDIYSAHADQGELLTWIGARMPVHRAIVLTHGEATTIARFKTLLENGIAHSVSVLTPALDDALLLRVRGRPRLVRGARRLADSSTAGRDWHNEYAAFLLDMRSALQAASSDDARARMLARLKGTLGRQARPAPERREAFEHDETP